ncbi:hypothetical protein [Candidatus Palauibacter sp.]|uniref:hypothetical protein n=1 Tax=Candidatus Palauibacter sp. TaxID=3101350 RepID=UPI003B014027
MNTRRDVLRWTFAVGLLAACGPRGDDMDGARPGAGTDSMAAGSALQAGEPSRSGAGDLDAPGGLLPGEGPPRVYRLLVVNPLDDDAFVFAAAAARRVALDTVPPRDSIRVDIRVRADVVLLEARDSSGTLLDSEDIALEREHLNHWIIGAGSAARVTPAAPDSLF